ncbi:MAG: aspartate carbamoyltransferase catalytic subunit [Pyrinomonadaceae bacterium]|nr:aspartate carbamoyltransferase catalytic subunit [Pyrinomonadaceae bacterium]MBP6212513.1 aspartate carbamoyltransferase catalytic subunit [Pyrinomonadaceae bacterium]
MEKPFRRRDLLGIRDLTADQIVGILDTAENFSEISTREVKKVPALRGKTVINLFFEASTRTRTSFELAAKRLSADAVNISVSSSSVSKGETLLDTAMNLDAMAPDCIVVRHSSAGVPHQLAKVSRAAIVNAGDGANEHPTQALLDAMTIREHKKQIAGLEVAIVGDILHSRVARSNIHLLTKMGAKVRVAGPGTLVPVDFQYLIDSQSSPPYEGGVAAASADGVVHSRPQLQVCSSVEDAITGADVVMILRIQRERQDAAYFPSLREYSIHYGLTNDRLDLAKKDAIVLHPGPMNRGIEIASDVADSSRSLILDQVKYGVAVRMAVLYLATGGASV